MKRFIPLLLPALLVTQAFAASSITRVGTTAAPFLGIGVGSRAMGMGGAYTSVGEDVSCLYWNPGSAVVLEQSEVLFIQNDYLADTDLNYMAFVTHLGDDSSVGISMTYLDYGEMEVTTLEDQEGTGEFFQASDLALGLTYSLRFTDRFSIGFTGKYVENKIWHEKANAMAFDVGTRFRTNFNGMVLGMGIFNYSFQEMEMSGTDLLVGHDLNPNQGGDNPAVPANLDVLSWSLPVTFRIGVSMYAFDNPLHSLLLSADASHPVDNSESISLGSEYGFRDRFFVRGGWHQLFLKDQEGGATLGAGLHLPLASAGKLYIDASWQDFGRLESVVRYSLRFAW